MITIELRMLFMFRCLIILYRSGFSCFLPFPIEMPFELSNLPCIHNGITKITSERRKKPTDQRIKCNNFYCCLAFPCLAIPNDAMPQNSRSSMQRWNFQRMISSLSKECFMLNSVVFRLRFKALYALAFFICLCNRQPNQLFSNCIFTLFERQMLNWFVYGFFFGFLCISAGLKSLWNIHFIQWAPMVEFTFLIREVRKSWMLFSHFFRLFFVSFFPRK